MTLIELFRKEFEREVGVTRRVLERVPDGRLDWKPHAKSFSLGQLAQHVATLPQWAAFLAKDDLDIQPQGQPMPKLPPSETRDALLALLESNAVCRSRVSGAGERCRARSPVDAARCGQVDPDDDQGGGLSDLGDEPPVASPRTACAPICASTTFRSRRSSVRRLTKWASSDQRRGAQAQEGREELDALRFTSARAGSASSSDAGRRAGRRP